WIDPCTVTFDPNGGTVDQTTANTGNYGKLVSYPYPVKSDYVFDGWFTDPLDGEKIGTDTIFQSNTTVYAHWSRPYYIDENGVKKEITGVTRIDSHLANLNESWYYVDGNVDSDRKIVIFDSNVNIILSDDSVWNANYGIKLNSDKTLTIYCQERGTGILNAKGDDRCPGIGAELDGTMGNLVIYGGTINAYGGECAPGIGGGAGGEKLTGKGGHVNTVPIPAGGMGTVTVNGGKITARRGHNNNYGIGPGYKGLAYGSKGTIILNLSGDDNFVDVGLIGAENITISKPLHYVDRDGNDKGNVTADNLKENGSNIIRAGISDPSTDPTTDPSTDPQNDPTTDPSTDPSTDPTTDPSIDPTTDPSTDPSTDPQNDPTTDPTTDPSTDPQSDPTTDPSTDPQNDPTTDPSTDPSTDPTTDPSTDPSADPSTAQSTKVEDVSVEFEPGVVAPVEKTDVIIPAAVETGVKQKYGNTADVVPTIKAVSEATVSGNGNIRNFIVGSSKYQEAVKRVSTDKVKLDYLDISLLVQGGTALPNTFITDPSGVVEVILKDYFKNAAKYIVSIWRDHKGSSEEFTEADTKTDKTYKIDGNNLLIYSSGYSTFAITYSTEPLTTGGSGNGNPGNGNSSGGNTGNGGSGGSGGSGVPVSQSTVSAPAPAPIVYKPVFRLFNTKTGEHFFTALTAEKESLLKSGWKDEGVAFSAPEKSDKPVYRFFNTKTGEHYFTDKESDKNKLAEEGYVYEGIAWYSSASKERPVYRMILTGKKRSVHYTASAAEKEALIKAGWKAEETGMYVR
ncbi:MAG: InlB B-repeat-containing protein, partial [Lachnospiraceae bacterium]|nr:InlB B-repeat-containing protein [Lachnospiraceae bacterium]